LTIASRPNRWAVALEPLPDTPHDELVISARSPFQGAKVSNLSPALADDLRLDPSTDGVVITAVTDGTPAQSLGFLRGDLVISVNNQKIAKTRDLERATSQPNRVWRITIMRGGQQMSVVLSG
jgi:S1-C subfamily serine protease